MNSDTLYLAQERLERESRDLTVRRYHRQIETAEKNDTAADTDVGNFLSRSYLGPVAEGIAAYLASAASGAAGRGRRATAYDLCKGIEPEVLAYLTLRALLNAIGTKGDSKPAHFTQTATAIGRSIHLEARLMDFETSHGKMLQKILADFDKRELPRFKRLEYLQASLNQHHDKWSAWSEPEMLHVGVAMLDVFKSATGDIYVEERGVGKGRRMYLLPSEGLVDLINRRVDRCEALFSLYMPMVVPPRRWEADTLNIGGYLTHEVQPYPLVKSSKSAYRRLLKERAEDGSLQPVLDAVNALQETPWRVNKRVLGMLEWAYEANIAAGKLPRSDPKEVPPPSPHLDALPEDHQERKDYRRMAFGIHEDNRRAIGKRLQAIRAIHMGKKFSSFERLYFPHDLDSRGRAYPKPVGLNPQGTDFVKAILEFADGKPLGAEGIFWLGVHGANCWGEDKVSMQDRYDWVVNNRAMILSIAAAPETDLRWVKADNPFQFLAFCFEWSEALDKGVDYVSHLHVDLDATCSGLQHFSAMLRDEVGGRYVNLLPGLERQDVYGAVAHCAMERIKADKDPDNAGFREAWIDFDLDRKIAKRPVMVKPYAGTLQSCTKYVQESVKERINDGEVSPVPKEDLWFFGQYGAQKLWQAIPDVVVAADDAMRWLSKIARLVGKSQPEDRRIEWTTPAGMPVHQYKFDMTGRRVNTRFEGSIFKLRLSEETDKLDARKMATSVAPSFVHSMDAAHLQLTVGEAKRLGMDHFAAVHDSFGVHAADVERFAQVIRRAFVDMYTKNDVLQQFLESALPFITEDQQGEIPPMPPKGSLDLTGVVGSEFFFS